MFHKIRSILWALFGVLSFFMGWQNNVMLVWIASVYANTVSDWGAAEAAEAADDHVLKERLDRILLQQDEILDLLKGGDSE